MFMLSLRSVIQSCCLVAVFLSPVTVFSEYVGCVQVTQPSLYTQIASSPDYFNKPVCGGSWPGHPDVDNMGVFSGEGITVCPARSDGCSWGYDHNCTAGKVVVGVQGSNVWGYLNAGFFMASPNGICKWSCSTVTMDCNTCIGTTSAPALTSVACSSSSPAATTVCGGKDYVGGCNNSSAYCSTSGVYGDLGALSNSPVAQGASEFNYIKETGSDGQTYYCIVSSKNSDGSYNLSIDHADPSVSSSCISEAAMNAYKNTCANGGVPKPMRNISPKTYSSSDGGKITMNPDGVWRNTGGTATYDPGTDTTTIRGGNHSQDGPVTSSDGSKNTGGTSRTNGGDLLVPGDQRGKTSGTGTTYTIGGDSYYISTTTTTTTTTTKTTTNPDGTTTTETTGTNPSWGGYYSGGNGSGRAAFKDDAIKDVSDFKALYQTFANDMKSSKLFAVPTAFFSGIPGGGSPDVRFSGGRFGTFSYNFSTNWASIIPVLKFIVLFICAAAVPRILILKSR